MQLRMAVFVLAMCVAACHNSSASGTSPQNQTNGQSAAASRLTSKSTLAPLGTYKLLAWSELRHALHGWKGLLHLCGAATL